MQVTASLSDSEPISRYPKGVARVPIEIMNEIRTNASRSVLYELRCLFSRTQSNATAAIAVSINAR